MSNNYTAIEEFDNCLSNREWALNRGLTVHGGRDTQSLESFWTLKMRSIKKQTSLQTYNFNLQSAGTGVLRLSHVGHVVPNRWDVLSLNWKEWLSCSGREWNIYWCGRALSLERHIWKLLVVVRWTTWKKCSDMRAARLFFVIQQLVIDSRRFRHYFRRRAFYFDIIPFPLSGNSYQSLTLTFWRIVAWSAWVPSSQTVRASITPIEKATHISII